MSNFHLITCLVIYSLVIQRIDGNDPVSPTSRLIKFRVSSSVARNICTQRREFEKSRTVQTPMRKKPKPSEESSWHPCISYFKMKNGGIGMKAMCTSTQVIKSDEASYTNAKMSYLEKESPSDSKAVNCTVQSFIEGHSKTSGTPANEASGSSGGERSGIHPKIQNMLWFYNQSDYCLMPIFYPYCDGGAGTELECKILSNLVRAVAFLTTSIPNLKFYFTTTIVDDPVLPDYLQVEVAPSLGCSSKFIGRQGGQNKITLGEGCSGMKSILHEISHALGISHEHQRIDRDEHVNVFQENIGSTDWAAQYTKDPDEVLTTFDIPYNQHSIMHFGPDTGAKPGTKAMEAKDGGAMGDGNIMQFSDLEVRRKMYASCKA